MPRLSETPRPRESARVPLRLKPSACSEANSLPRAAAAAVAMDRSSKIENRRPSRTVLQEQKKRGSRMADLEQKLDQTMEELRKLKEQLAFEESSKRAAEKKHEKPTKDAAVSPSQTSVSSADEPEAKEETILPVEIDGESCVTTDVCEVALSCSEENEGQIESEVSIGGSTECPEMADVKAKLAEKEKELEGVVAEKESVEKEAEKAMESSCAERKKGAEIEVRLAGAEEELRQSKATIEQMRQKLEAQEAEKASMAAEMKCLRIQSDQWRKASEAAASILGDESLRSGSKPPESSSDGWSTLIAGAEADEGPIDQKRRGSGGGIRVLGELWKKRGQMK